MATVSDIPKFDADAEMATPPRQRQASAPPAPEPKLVERLASQAREALNEFITSHQLRSADRVAAIADALHRQSEASEESPLSPFISRAADQLDRAQELLVETNLDDAIVATRRFARRRPLLFLGGALLFGAACARFLKSSADLLAEVKHAARAGEAFLVEDEDDYINDLLEDEQ